MRKTLKFRSQFISSIQGQDRIITIRLYDDKDLTVGDKVDLLNSETNEKFASGKIDKIRETSFAEAVKGAADVEGMYEIYQEYHDKEVRPDDPVKWVSLELF